MSGLLRSLTKPAATVGNSASSRKTEILDRRGEAAVFMEKQTFPWLLCTLACLRWLLVIFHPLAQAANGPKLLTACNTSYPVTRRVLADVTASVLGESVGLLCSGMSSSNLCDLDCDLTGSIHWGCMCSALCLVTVVFFGGLALSYSLG